MGWRGATRFAPCRRFAQTGRRENEVGRALRALQPKAALLGGHLDAGLAPRANAWSATVAAMLGFQGLHVAIVSLMAIYLCALWSRRLPQTLSRTSTSNVALFWHFSNVQAVLVAIVPHLVAWGMKS